MVTVFLTSTAILVLLYVLTGLFLVLLARLRSSCPRCRLEEHTERIPRSPFIKFFYSYLPLKAYRCRRCMIHFIG